MSFSLKNLGDTNKIVAGVILALTLMFAFGLLMQFEKSSATPQVSPSPSPTPTPSSSERYVEVDYVTVGWFYATNQIGSESNYTYLVLNLTITNHGYPEADVSGLSGLEVKIDNDTYAPAKGGVMFNQAFPQGISHVTGNPVAALSNMQSISTMAVFQFSKSPQIWNQPFVFLYDISSVSTIPAIMPSMVTVTIFQK
jgi:hypothetical protein